LENGDELTLAFQGGEPTLAGLPYFKEVVALINQQEKKVKVNFALQTNGILIDDQWAEFLKANHFLVGLSLDLIRSVHDRNRVNPNQTGTFQQVMATKKLLDAFEIEYNILCVLTSEVAAKPKKVFEFIKKHHIQYVQFVPCLDELENTGEPSEFALTPKQFARFYQELLPLWLNEWRQGHYFSVKLFDDLYNLLVNQTTTACGILGKCQIQYIVEADGGVYPCDFYVLDEYRIGNIRELSLRELFDQELQKEPNFLTPHQSPSYCKTCPFLAVCHGGCKRMSQAVYVNQENNYCGYQEFLGQFIPQLPLIKQLVQ
jgi:uncharacterized protein